MLGPRPVRLRAQRMPVGVVSLSIDDAVRSCPQDGWLVHFIPNGTHVDALK
jgi:hypothetical protein